jgi:hypothetical protein
MAAEVSLTSAPETALTACRTRKLPFFKLVLICWCDDGLATLRTSGHLEHVRQVKTNMADLDTVTNYTLQTYISVLERMK